MAKPLAASTQLKAAQAKIMELEKQLGDALKTREAQYAARSAAEAELEQLHQMLDAVPGPIPRRDEGTYTDRKVITRLAAWLASTK